MVYSKLATHVFAILGTQFSFMGLQEFVYHKILSSTLQVCVRNTKEAELIICEEAEQSSIGLCMLLEIEHK